LNKAILLVFFVLFSSLAAAQLIDLNPVQGNEFLYPNEVAEFELNLINSAENEIEKLIFNVSAEGDLILLSNDKEVQSIKFEFNRIAPQENLSRKFKVKATGLSKRKDLIIVDYGKEVFTKSINYFVEIKRNPVILTPSISKSALNVQEKSVIEINVNNLSGRDLSNLSSELIVPREIVIASSSELDESLPAGRNAEADYEFQANFFLEEQNYAVLKVFYEFEGKNKEFQFNYILDVGDRSRLLIILIILIALLIGASFYLNKGEDNSYGFHPKEMIETITKWPKK